MLALRAALCTAALEASPNNVNTDYITPEFTFSPDHRYGVMIPVWHDEGAQQSDDRKNQIVELSTHRVVASYSRRSRLRLRFELPRDRAAALVSRLICPALESEREVVSGRSRADQAQGQSRAVAA